MIVRRFARVSAELHGCACAKLQLEAGQSGFVVQAAPLREPPAQTAPQTIEQSFTWKERSAVVAPGAAAIARESCETPHHDVEPPCAWRNHGRSSPRARSRHSTMAGQPVTNDPIPGGQRSAGSGSSSAPTLIE